MPLLPDEIKFFAGMGVEQTDAADMVNAMNKNDYTTVDRVLYRIVTSWDCFGYGPDINEPNFLRLMHFIRTGDME